MTKVLVAIAILGLIPAVVFSQAPTGIHGSVYDHNGNLAGTTLDTIYFYDLGSSGTASYRYIAGTSDYLSNDTYGLYYAHWGWYGETIEDGVHYYSPCYTHWWNGDWYGQDIHCTRTTPPIIPWDP